MVLPRPSDQLWIVTDGSVKQRGIGATLYVTRGTKTYLAGFFSAKLPKHQVTWLPCEVEALAIAAATKQGSKTATKHFAPFITQSRTPTTVLTDSKPCVQASQKLARGEYSASPRVTTFLSTISRYQVSVLHLAGSDNIPSDFASRNAPECVQYHCQICSFISALEEAPVHQVVANDVLTGMARMPFTSRSTWLHTQPGMCRFPALRTPPVPGHTTFQKSNESWGRQTVPPGPLHCQGWPAGREAFRALCAQP